MFNFISLCIIVFIILKIIKKQNGQNGSSQDKQSANHMPMPDERGYRETTGGFQGQKRTGNALRAQTQTSRTSRTAQRAENPAPEPAEKEQSTTAYLSEKARQDQREHVAEKLQEKKRMDQKYGNRPVGGRYMLGDPVPQGMKIVCCGYCGAENVVRIDYRGDRDCYFCRTRLER